VALPEISPNSHGRCDMLHHRDRSLCATCPVGGAGPRGDLTNGINRRFGIRSRRMRESTCHQAREGLLPSHSPTPCAPGPGATAPPGRFLLF